jgi:hypothetical protein
MLLQGLNGRLKTREKRFRSQGGELLKIQRKSGILPPPPAAIPSRAFFLLDETF